MARQNRTTDLSLSVNARKALEYHERGLAVIPIQPRGKKPILADWPNARLSPDELKAAFTPDMNIGALMGSASNGIVDIDLDCPEAIQVADYFLPATNMRFGRASAPNSHRFYRTTATERRVTFSCEGMIAEIRGEGHCTVLPGSVHESGEEVRFDDAGDPAVVEWTALLQAVSLTCSSAELLKHYKEGKRHDLALAVAGAMANAGVPEETTTKIMGAVAAAAQDTEKDDRLLCVRTTYQRKASGEPVAGLSKLAEYVGETAARKIVEWAGGAMFRAASEGQPVLNIENFRTDATIAKMFTASHRTKMIYSDEARSWFERQGHVYRPSSPTAAQRVFLKYMRRTAGRIISSDPSKETRQIARSLKSASRISSVMRLAQSDFLVPYDQLDADPMRVGCSDGRVLDLATRSIVEEPTSIITKTLGTSFDGGADCPRWKEFLHRSFDGNADVVAFIQRALGYTLTGFTREQCLFAMVGSGANGKSTFLRTAQLLLGDYAGTTPMQTLVVNRSEQSNDVARLVGKRLVAASEGEAGQKLAVAKIKQLTGGDRITCRALYKEFFEFLPQFKLWLATNDLPNVPGGDEALWRRIYVIHFPVTIPPNERDPSLPEKLQAELPGILNWTLDGLVAWQADQLNPPEAVKVATGRYRQANDTVGEFIETVCIRDSAAKASVKTLYDAYVEWAGRSGYDPVSKAILGKAMTTKGFEKYRSANGNGYLGICVRPELEPDIDSDEGQF